MRNLPFALVSAALASSALPNPAFAADGPLAMTPTSNWSVDYAEDSCALRRTFESGGDKMGLELRQLAPGDDFEVVLVSTTLSRTSAAPRARFEPDSGWFKPLFHRLLDSQSSHGVGYTDSLRPNALKPFGETPPAWAPEERIAREQAVTALTVGGSFEREITLQTGSMHQPLAALRKCMDDLVTQWGLDPQVQATLSRAAQPVDQMGWARRIMQNYPRDMLRANKSARVPIRVIVGADGKPASCAASMRQAEPSFEQAACAATIEYARFVPALDASGTPVPSIFATTVVYAISN